MATTKQVVTEPVEPIGRQKEMLASIDCAGWDAESVAEALVDRGLPIDGSLEELKARLTGAVTDAYEAEGERVRAERAKAQAAADAERERAENAAAEQAELAERARMKALEEAAALNEATRAAEEARLAELDADSAEDTGAGDGADQGALPVPIDT